MLFAGLSLCIIGWKVSKEDRDHHYIQTHPRISHVQSAKRSDSKVTIVIVHCPVCCDQRTLTFFVKGSITVPMACRQLYWIGFYQTKNMLLFVCSKATESIPVKLKTVIVTTMFL